MADDILGALQAPAASATPASPPIPSGPTVEPAAPAPAPAKPTIPPDDLVGQMNNVPSTDTWGGALGAGVRSSLIGLRGTGLALKGIAQSIFSDQQSVDDTMSTVQQLNETQGALAPRYNSVEDLVANGNLGDYLSYVGHALGEQSLNIASVVASGGVGALVGRKAAEMAAKGLIDETAARLLTEKFTERGAKVGAYLASTALESGATVQEQYQATGKIDPLVALLAGGIKGAFEEVTPLLLARKLGISQAGGSRLFNAIDSQLSRTFGEGAMGRIARGGLEALGTEATTEAIQEAVDVAARRVVDKNYDMFGPDARSRILNSAVQGGLVGMIFGGATGLVGGHAEGHGGGGENLTEIFGGGEQAGNNGPSSPGTPPIVPPPSGATVPPTGTTVTPPVAGATTGQSTTVPSTPATSIGMADLPTKVTQTEGFDIPQPAHQYWVAAITGNNTANKLEQKGAPADEVKKWRDRAQAALDEAQKQGLVRAQIGAAPATPGGIAQTGPESDLYKAFPASNNQFINAAITAVRDLVRKQGGLDVLPPKMKAAVLATPLTPVRMGSLLSKTAQQIEQAMPPGKTIDLGGTAYTVSNSTFNTSTGQLDLELKDPSGQIVKQSIPLGASDIHSIATTLLQNAQQKGQTILNGQAFKGNPLIKRIFQNYSRPGRLSLGSGGLDIHTPEGFKRGKVTVDATKLEPGKVYTVNTGQVTQAPMKPVPSQLMKLAQHLVTKLLPNEKIIIEHGPTSRYFPSSGAKGYYANLGNGTHLIWLADRPTESQLSTLAHEIGHMVMTVHFNNAPFVTQMAVFNEWIDQINAATNQTGEDLQLRFGNWTRMTETMEFIESGGSAPLDDPMMASFYDWFNFDEYMAEQTAKWMLSSETPSGIVDKFFSGMATKMKQTLAAFMQKFNRDPAQMQVGEMAGGWLQSLYERRNAKQPTPLLLPAFYNNALAESTSNAKALGLDTVSMDRDDILWSAPPGDLSTGNVRRMASAGLLTSQHKAQTDRYNGWIKKTWNLLQIADKNQHIVPLMQYVERVRQWSLTRMQLISRANDTLKLWHRLGQRQSLALSNFLFAVDSMEYLPAGQNARWPTQQELMVLAQKYGVNQRGAAVYMRIRGDFLHILDRIEQAWIKDAQQTLQNPVELAQRLQEISQEMLQLRGRPYFPHSRFGQYALQVRDQKGKLVFFQQFERPQDARAAVPAAKKRFPVHQVILDKMPEDVMQFRGLPPGLLKSLKTKLQLTRQQSDWLDNFIFDLSPANSFLQKFRQRKDIAGYSMDAQRAYASYFLHGAGHIARVEQGAALQQAVLDTRESRKSLPDLGIREKDKRQSIADWMQRHLDYIMGGDSEWAALRSLAFQFYLGFALDSALLNLTQVPMVAAPYLTTRFGTFGGLNALRKNGLQLLKFANLGGQISSDKAAAISEAIAQGFLDEAQASALAAVSEGGPMAKMLQGNAIQRGIIQLGSWSSYFFQEAEKVNRRIVFGSGYDLAKSQPNAPHLAALRSANQLLYRDLLAKGWTPENATAFLAGRDAVERTQFEYAKWARPEFMRGKKGVLFTFYMFQQNMLWFFKNSPGGTRALIALLAASGASGLPGAGDTDELIRWISEHIFGNRWKPSEELRKLLLEFTNHPDIIMHGLGRESLGLTAVGDAMGLPIPSVDLSARMGFGQIVPGLQALVAPGNESFAERLGNVTHDVLGATFGLGLNLAKALESGKLDEFRTWQALLPRAFKNVAKAYSMVENKGVLTQQGANIVPMDVQDTKTRAEIAMQALGFVPTSVTQKWELIAAQRQTFQYWQARRAELLYEADRARQAADSEAMSAVMHSVGEYNRSVPSGQLHITMKELKQSLKERAVSRALEESTGSPQRGYVGVARQVQQLYPEAAVAPSSSSP